MKATLTLLLLSGALLAADLEDLVGFAWPPGPAPLSAGAAVTVPGPDGEPVMAWRIVTENGRHPRYPLPWRAALPGVRYSVSIWVRRESGTAPRLGIEQEGDEDWRPEWRNALATPVESRGGWQRYQGWFTPAGPEAGSWRLVLVGPAAPISEFLVTGIDVQCELPPLDLPASEAPEALVGAAAAACREAREAARAAELARIHTLLERGAE